MVVAVGVVFGNIGGGDGGNVFVHFVFRKIHHVAGTVHSQPAGTIGQRENPTEMVALATVGDVDQPIAVFEKRVSLDPTRRCIYI